MTKSRKIAFTAGFVLLAVLGGCANGAPMSSDFGNAVHASIAQQIANPEAKYTGKPDTGASGARVELMQERYATGKVTKPAATGAATNVKPAAPEPAS